MNVTIEKLDPSEIDAPGIPLQAQQPSNSAQIGNLLDSEDAIDAGDLDSISTGGEQKYTPVSLKVNAKQVRVYVRELNYLEIVDVEAGRVLVRAGQVLRAPAFEAKMGMALELCATVYKKASGEYVPMFADAKAAQEWITRPNQLPVVAQLTTAIYLANPLLSPKKKAEAAKSLS